MFAIKKSLLLTIVVVSGLVAEAEARQKTDVVHMLNGDRITGEIKELDRGRLQVSTDSMGSLSIEWDDIKRLESDYVFQFERSDGTRVTGTIEPSPDATAISVLGSLGRVTFAHERIVRIEQIEDTFWDRVDGSMTVGYSFTKASDVTQFNFGFRASLRTEKHVYSADGSTVFTNDQAGDETARSDLQLDMTRLRRNRWFNSYLGGFESNDALGLDLRTSLGAAIGRYWIQTNDSRLAAIAGLMATVENLNPVFDIDAGTLGKSSQENLEALLGVQYARYMFDEPTLDMTVKLRAFPSLTDSGRTRAQLDVGVRWELIKDLFWDLSYYNTYDSDPPSGSEATNDYGVITSIGWSF